MEQEEKEARERVLREEEERMLAAHKAEERARRDTQDRNVREARERGDRERAEKAIRGTIRVRGTRASMRAQTARGGIYPVTTTACPRLLRTFAAGANTRGTPPTSQTGIRRPSSATGTRPSGPPTRGTSRRS